jgi:DNA-binding transcriptional LysR family regulator
MRTSKFTPEQMVMALRQVEAGTPIEDVCRGVDNMAMAMSLVASTRGVALMPAYAKNLLPPSVVSRPPEALTREILPPGRDGVYNTCPFPSNVPWPTSAATPGCH